VRERFARAETRDKLSLYDIAIIGGGPAGAAAALSLRQLRPSLRVAIFEASHYSEWRAGETLSPGCQDLLHSLGCWDRFLAEGFLESFGTRATWGSEKPYESEFLFSAHGNGWHVDRTRFDAALCDCARRTGVEIFEDARLTTTRHDGDWQLVIRRAGQTETHSARFVIDATGRSAAFAVQQGARRIVDDRLTGVFVRFRFRDRSTPDDTYTFVEAQPDGWWYSSYLPGGDVVVAWMSDADIVRSHGLHESEAWMEHLTRSRLTSLRIENADRQTTPDVWAAQSQRLTPVHGDGWVAAGDAAATFDPLSSAGILKALRSGKIASFVALDSLEGRGSAQRYQDLADREYCQYLETRTAFYRMERRWPQSPFWQRRHQSQNQEKS
jgi:flavin-dependent dehydrogenase